jgi:hypothetical protein
MKQFLLILICSGIFATTLPAQAEELVKNKLELRLSYALQRPFYAPNASSLINVKRDFRLRNAASLGIRYYVSNRFFAEYQIGYSQEGGGYEKQYTNADYVKNTFLIGLSARHSQNVIFDFSTGLDFNVLLDANFKSRETDDKEAVRSYFNKTQLSFPLALGFKTKIGDDTYLGLQTFGSVSRNVSTEVSTKTMQFLFPAFKVNLSKIL